MESFISMNFMNEGILQLRVSWSAGRWANGRKMPFDSESADSNSASGMDI